jgi:hypothetical protein
MTPKQKAEELLDYFIGVTDKEIDPGRLVPKVCALKVVDEILDEYWNDDSTITAERYSFWRDVKDELIVL